MTTAASCPASVPFLGVALLLAGLAFPSAAEAQRTGRATALVGATLIDGTGAPPVEDAVVLMRNGRIACAGTRTECPVPGDVRVIDVSGRWIIPGLVDAHVHYSQTGWADGRPDALDVRGRYPYAEVIHTLELHPERFYRAYLCTGVTATFDVGGYPWTWELRKPENRPAASPHVAAAGPLLSTIDHWVNLPAERQFIYMATDSATRAGAQYLVVNDTDAIKVWYLVGPSTDTAFVREQLRIAAEVAEESGTPLIVHATGLWQAKDALRAGADMLVHSVQDQPVDEEFLRLARRAGVIYIPTLTVLEGYIELAARDFDPSDYGESLECVDPATRRKAFLTDSFPGAPSSSELLRIKRRARERYELMLDNLERIHEAGIPVAMGTDAGNPLTLHGPAAYIEMAAMAEAGLSPMEVIVSSTKIGALAMGRLDDFGTIEEGKIADLVVLRENPLADISNVRSVELVVRGGRVWEREELEFPRTDRSPPDP